jgi:uncharacterized protein YbaR (Trm112 family)
VVTGRRSALVDNLKEHLEILRCPITGSPLRLMSSEELSHVNAVIPNGALTEALVTVEGGEYAYRIEDGILILLKDLAIPLGVEGAEGKAIEPGETAEKKRVKDFYNSEGWTLSAEETFVDASKFEDLRPVSKDYIHKCHMRVKRHIRGGGKYLLDVASGPVQYPEYLTYSSGFDFRICMDFSIGALRISWAI